MLWSQAGGGSASGVVVDPSGAAVANARVEITNTATGVSQVTTSTSAGQFVFPVLPVGTYTLSVAAQGFRKAVVNGVTVALDQTTNANVTLQIGNVQQQVEVSASTAQIQPDTAQQATTITPQVYQSLPLSLNGEARSVTGFLFLAPGVNFPVSTPTQQTQTFSTSINGGQAFSSEVIVDGASIQSSNVAGDYRNLQFPVDIVNEFTLVSNNFTADYGRAPGGIVSITTKSGTNALHGTAYEYLRNTALDARGFFQPTTPVEHQNEYGFDVGGPVLIPHVYNGKNRTFFFGYWSGFKNRQGALNYTGTTPTQAERNGDFSAYPYPIYDPLTNAPDGSGGTTRTQFPGNIIPTSRINPVALKMNSLLPSPDNSSLVNNITAGEGAYNNTNRWGVKIDHTITENQRLSGEIFVSRVNYSEPQSGNVYAGALSNTILYTQNDELARLNYTWVIRPNLLNQFTMGFNRNYNPYQPPGTGSNLGTALGIPGIPGQNLPAFSWTGYASVGDGDAGQIVAETSYVYNDFVSWTAGKHTFKFGVDYRRDGDNTRPNNQSTFGFSPLETSLPDSANRALTGNAYASFLLGATDSATLNLYPSETGNRFAYFAGYAMDDYKVSRRLTLNLGVRYDLPWTRTEVDNRMSTFNPSVPNPDAGGLLGAYIFAGYGPGRCDCTRFSAVDYSLIQPRFGFAFKADDKTVIRGGYSVFDGATGDVLENGIRVNYTAGFNISSSAQTPDNGLTPAFYIQNGYPHNYGTVPDLNPGLNVGQGANWLAPEDGKPAFVQNWNFDIQRDLGWRTLLEAAYVGNKASRLASGLVNPNQLNPEYLSLGSLLTDSISSPAAIAAGFTSPYPGFSGTVAQALRPYPQYLTISRDNQTAGASSYNALQVKLQHQMKAGLSLLVSYTWSKWLTNAESGEGWYDSGPQNNYDRKAEWSLSSMDVPQSVTISYVYQLPVGKGKAVNTSGVLDSVVGGWSLSGISRYQSGYPLGITVTDTMPLFNAVQRPNCLVGINQYASYAGSFDPAVDAYINTAAFSDPGSYSFGNCGRELSSLRGFPFFNEDVALSKHFLFGERVDAQFRFDVFNVFNRVVFSNPDTNLGDQGFGIVGGQTNTPRVAQVGLNVRF